ncbi:MAG TPA: hypothetical protein VMH41_14365 [Mycobacteriales bacterium]|nr:hypothetical protein [Mycobacteriales bacterium]
MDTCSSCGAALTGGAQWCGQCFALIASAVEPAPAAIASGVGRHVPVTMPRVVVRKTRWGKTPTTFGPVGRVVATTGFVVPFIVFVLIGIATSGFLIDGAVLWGLFIMPLGLRDVWKAGQIPTN